MQYKRAWIGLCDRYVAEAVAIFFAQYTISLDTNLSIPRRTRSDTKFLLKVVFGYLRVLLSSCSEDDADKNMKCGCNWRCIHMILVIYTEPPLILSMRYAQRLYTNHPLLARLLAFGYPCNAVQVIHISHIV